MSKIIKFPVDYPPHQWPIRIKILRYVDLLGWSMERLLRGFSDHPASWWPNLPDESLKTMLVYVQEEYMYQTAVKRYEARIEQQRKPEVESVRKKAEVIPFPITPEILTRQKAIAKQKAAIRKTGMDQMECKVTPEAKPPRIRTYKRAVNGLTRTPEEKRLTRQIKMVQRDCERKLHVFDDAAYRLILKEQYGVQSSTELKEPELKSLLNYLLRLLRNNGTHKPSFESPPELLRHDPTGIGRNWQMRKIEALLSEKGSVEEKYVPWAYALGILKRQTRGDITEFDNATPEHLNAVIAALIRDAKRKGRWTP